MTEQEAWTAFLEYKEDLPQELRNISDAWLYNDWLSYQEQDEE